MITDMVLVSEIMKHLKGNTGQTPDTSDSERGGGTYSVPFTLTVK